MLIVESWLVWLRQGLYDRNIWVLYDVWGGARGVAAGLMNSLGCLGAEPRRCDCVAASRYGMSVCVSATAAIYLLIACCCFGARPLRRRGLELQADGAAGGAVEEPA